MTNQDHIVGAVRINRHNFGVAIAQSRGETITFLGLYDHNLGVANHNFGAAFKCMSLKNRTLKFIFTEKTALLDHDLSLLRKEDRSYFRPIKKF